MAISARVESSAAVCWALKAGVEELIANGIGLVLGMRCVCCGFACFGFVDGIEEGKRDLNADGGVVLLEAEVVVLKVIELCEAAVLRVEGDLRPPQIAGFAEGGLALGTGEGVGGVDGGTGDRWWCLPIGGRAGGERRER